MELPDFNCVLCNDRVEESLSHLLLHCPFATACWNWLNVQVMHQSDAFQNLESFKSQLQVLPPSRKEYNYGIRAGQSSLSLTKFISNSINIYVSK